jgi:hypothetical protein
MSAVLTVGLTIVRSPVLITIGWAPRGASTIGSSPPTSHWRPWQRLPASCGWSGR